MTLSDVTGGLLHNYGVLPGGDAIDAPLSGARKPPPRSMATYVR